MCSEYGKTWRGMNLAAIMVGQRCDEDLMEIDHAIAKTS